MSPPYFEMDDNCGGVVVVSTQQHHENDGDNENNENDSDDPRHEQHNNTEENREPSVIVSMAHTRLPSSATTTVSSKTTTTSTTARKPPLSSSQRQLHLSQLPSVSFVSTAEQPETNMKTAQLVQQRVRPLKVNVPHHQHQPTKQTNRPHPQQQQPQQPQQQSLLKSSQLLLQQQKQKQLQLQQQAKKNQTAAELTKQEKTIRETTELVLEDLGEESPFFSLESGLSTHVLPRFETSEVQVGAILGHGEFGAVWEITSIQVTVTTTTTEQQPPQPGHKRTNTMNSCDTYNSMNASTRRQKELFRRLPSAITFAEDTKFTEPLDSEDEEEEDETEGNDVTDHSALTEHVGLGIDTNYIVTESVTTAQQPPPAAAAASTGSVRYLSKSKKARAQMANQCVRNGVARYALKRVKDETDLPSLQAKVDAAIDLACEAKFLSRLQHPNVVRMRGTVGEPGTLEFAILMDRLTETLETRIIEWQGIAKHSLHHSNRLLDKLVHSLTAPFRSNNNNKPTSINGSNHTVKVSAHELMMDQLLAAFDIARGMRYLHHYKILYRDLKPDNIGFDVRGDVRIFDFGLAKELRPKDLVQPPDGYEATGLTGSRRFMAPECVRCLPYGLSADVYSFSILLWQMFALQMPFHNYDARKHFEMVVERGKRPNKLPTHIMPASIQKLMKECWSVNPLQRPTFVQICSALQSEISIQAEEGKEYYLNSLGDRTEFLADRSQVSIANYVENL